MTQLVDVVALHHLTAAACSIFVRGHFATAAANAATANGQRVLELIELERDALEMVAAQLVAVGVVADHLVGDLERALPVHEQLEHDAPLLDHELLVELEHDGGHLVVYGCPHMLRDEKCVACLTASNQNASPALSHTTHLRRRRS